MSLPPLPSISPTASTPGDGGDTGVTPYPTVPLVPYFMAVLVVGMPILYFQSTGQQEWVNKYILLVALMLLLFYQTGFGRFSQYMYQLRAQTILAK